MIEDIEQNYNSSFIVNKYDEKLRSNTHKEQFEFLLDKFKDDEEALKQIHWIIDNYQCDIIYGEDHFAYLKEHIND